MSGHYEARTTLGRVINEIEETLIAVFLGLMTVITFVNVVARYVFNANVLWALEATVFLFAWLVLFGVSYCVKITAHLGVDALVSVFSPPIRRVITMFALIATLAYAVLLLVGSWDYWYKFATTASFLEVNDVPFPDWIQIALGLTDEGEPLYDYLPRYIPYFILPFGMALFLARLLEAGWDIITGRRTMLIASHEVEEMLEEVAAQRKED
ncbi:TRAP transporter small permease [Limibaculum sp. M0105]|uniref:TRAP transporter small permease protein n=1 Tax=Thermohalobaculum xanthum TaxID=2753746 RepID=A0A8J7SJ53_9RHOB|nr:TRAP transporter small permease [Thermohalobaculum xanthum]MBK0400745.1 TRAP transporter small permease [Thermohalobaculum xanthum]